MIRKFVRILKSKAGNACRLQETCLMFLSVAMGSLQWFVPSASARTTGRRNVFHRSIASIRNGTSQVVAMRKFEASERDSFAVAVSPSGTKLALTWLGKRAPGCSSDEQRKGTCKGGIVIDLSGRLK